MRSFGLFGCCLLAVAIAPAADKKADAVKGKATFQQQCNVCHNPDSTVRKVGPGLKGLFRHDKLVNGKKPSDVTVRAKIEEGGNGMPPYKDMLSEQEKDNVVAFLKTL